MSIIDRAYGAPGVQGAHSLLALPELDKVGKPETNLGESFSKALTDAKELDKEATSQADRFAAHDPSVGIHEVIIASEKANIAVRYAVTLKNKALEAYHELMNTQV
ncbi:MAG: flagellar hook-basal body complex protein FliE [Kofleriaceae bacterium]